MVGALVEGPSEGAGDIYEDAPNVWSDTPTRSELVRGLWWCSLVLLKRLLATEKHSRANLTWCWGRSPTSGRRQTLSGQQKDVASQQIRCSGQQRDVARPQIRCEPRGGQSITSLARTHCPAFHQQAYCHGPCWKTCQGSLGDAWQASVVF